MICDNYIVRTCVQVPFINTKSLLTQLVPRMKSRSRVEVCCSLDAGRHRSGSHHVDSDSRSWSCHYFWNIWSSSIMNYTACLIKHILHAMHVMFWVHHTFYRVRDWWLGFRVQKKSWKIIEFVSGLCRIELRGCRWVQKWGYCPIILTGKFCSQNRSRSGWSTTQSLVDPTEDIFIEIL